MLAGVAVADEATRGDIDIFFSESNTIQHMQPQVPEVVVDVSGGPVVKRLYIWANIDLNDHALWNGLGRG